MSNHSTELKVNWKGSFNGRGGIEAGGLSQELSLPKEFGGLGVGTTPEELFLASFAGCFLITLGIILNKAEVSYQSLSLDAELLTRPAPDLRMETVVLRLQIATHESKDKLDQLASKVDAFCLVAKAVKGNIEKRVEITITQPTNELCSEVTQ